jgi:aminoglycoside phosphotransferase (APT) family kinase protein
MPFKASLCKYVQKILGKVLHRSKGRQKRLDTDSEQPLCPEPTTQLATDYKPTTSPNEVSQPATNTKAPDVPAWTEEMIRGPSPSPKASKPTTNTLVPEPPTLTEFEIDEMVWGSTRNIDDTKLVRLAQKHLGAKYGDNCQILDKKEGSYNRVHIMQFGDDDGFKFIIRVPGCGRPDTWTPEDAAALRSQALTMNYIKRHTQLPVPEVLAYENTCNNDFGHPFIITTFLKGWQLYEVWNGDYCSDLEGKRLRILRSLAKTMSEFDKLSFDAAGSLYFENDVDDNPKVGPRFTVHESLNCTERHTSFTPSYNNTHKHFMSLLDQWWDELGTSASLPMHYVNRGLSKILTLAVDCIPHELEIIDENEDQDESEDGSDSESEEEEGSNEEGEDEGEESEHGEEAKAEVDDDSDSDSDTEMEDPPNPETFVLMPPDFNWQNIMVDEDCNITGLLDWDNVATAPRLLGFTKIPIWLTEDWDQAFKWDGAAGESDIDLERYRKAYAGYMAEAMGEKGDCMYTGKSHLYAMLQYSLEDYDCTLHNVVGWLRAILPRTDPVQYLQRLGDPEAGFQEGEVGWMRGRLRQLFQCFPGPDDRFSF